MTSLTMCRSASGIVGRQLSCGPMLFQNKFQPVLATTLKWKRLKSDTEKIESKDNPIVKTWTRREQLKRAIAEYGSTVIVFHVGISLVSLGGCYLLVSSGIDMGKILVPIGLDGTIAANAGTFVTAYAIHKVFAPVRISVTLASTPFIVRYLRSIGFLKKK